MYLSVHNSDFAQLYQLLDKDSRTQCQFSRKIELQKDSVKEAGYFLNTTVSLRSCARDLAEKAKIEANYGDSNKALYFSLAGLRLPKCLSNEPWMVAQLIRLAMDAIALNTLQEVVNKGGETLEIYRLLINEIETEREKSLISKRLKMEFMFFTLPYFAHIRELGNRVFELTEEEKTEIKKIYQKALFLSNQLNEWKKIINLYSITN